QYNRLGSPVHVQADVRVLAGTNVDLERAVADGKFRQDLLYRLDVITIRMPSLAERREDIAEMATAFCAEACRSEGHGLRSLSCDAVRAVEAAEWPGNVRQLENTVQRAVLRAISEGVMQIERRHLFPDGPGGRPAGGEAGRAHLRARPGSLQQAVSGGRAAAPRGHGRGARGRDGRLSTPPVRAARGARHPPPPIASRRRAVLDPPHRARYPTAWP